MPKTVTLKKPFITLATLLLRPRNFCMWVIHHKWTNIFHVELEIYTRMQTPYNVATTICLIQCRHGLWIEFLCTHAFVMNVLHISIWQLCYLLFVSSYVTYLLPPNRMHPLRFNILANLIDGAVDLWIPTDLFALDPPTLLSWSLATVVQLYK